MSNQAMIDALLTEREGYVRAGKTERVAQVDTQLAQLGYTVPAAVKRAHADGPTPVDATAATTVKRGPGRPRKNHGE